MRGFMLNRSILFLSLLILLSAACATGEKKEARTCPVHQIPMESELVVLRNGTSTWEYQEAREKYFPFSGTVYTGNALPNTQQQISQAYICPECRKTELKWFKGELASPENSKDKEQKPAGEEPKPAKDAAPSAPASP
jgi:hypothetical protein